MVRRRFLPLSSLLVLAVTLSGCSLLYPETSDPTGTATVSWRPPDVDADVEQVIDIAGILGKLGFNNADQVLRSPDGNLHIVWFTADGVVHGAQDGDGSWTTSVVTETPGVSLPALVDAGTTLVAGWVRPGGFSAAKSTDGGATWTPIGGVNADGLVTVSLAADPDGTVVATWQMGDEDDAEVWFAPLDLASGDWQDATRLDTTGAGSAWPSIEVHGDDVFVTWRDQRDGIWDVWLRRSTDGGAHWLDEQRIAGTNSGDPSVCSGGGAVWLGHHGLGDITLWRSTDGGATFQEAGEVGRGWFAHLSCADDGSVAVGWEATDQPPKAPTPKRSGIAAYDADGTLLRSEAFGSDTTTAAVFTDGGHGDLVWIENLGGAPGTGALYHVYLALP